MRKKGGKKDKMKKNRKFPGAVIAVGIMLIGGMIFCQFVYRRINQETVSAKEIKEAFAYEEGALVPVYHLDQGQKLVFDFDLDYQYIEDYIVEETELVTVHTAPSCSGESEVICYTETSETDGGTRLVVAPVEPVLANDSLRQENLVNDSSGQGNSDGSDDNNGMAGLEDYKTFWGCAPVYYICLHYETDSREPVKSENPRIIPFTVRSESEVPDLEGLVSDCGELTLSWSEAEGADYYTVYQYVTSDGWIGDNNEANRGAESGYSDGLFYAVARTQETRFSDFGGNGKEEEVSGTQDEKGDFGDMPLSQQAMQNLNAYGCFFVTATVEGKESNLSAPVDTADLKLPYQFEDADMAGTVFESADEFPEMLGVVNIDGSIMQRPVCYRLGSVGAYAVYDYQVKGTLLGGRVFLDMANDPDTPAKVSYDADTVWLDTNAQLNKTPSMAVKSILAQEGTWEEADLYESVQNLTDEYVRKGNRETVPKPDEGITVFADSAEEAWLAYGLLAGRKEISVKAFPALQNPYVLEDVFLKVCMQNPYILGVSSYSYDYDNACLRVGYAYSGRQIKQKQKKIHEKAQAVAADILREDMSDEEKEMRIYLWLEQNCRYAKVEWEQAKEQNFLKSGRQAHMEDALNAYGALVGGEALCQGYAGAFQILGSIAGLNVRTANGYLNGNIPHAWNLIELNGNWYQVDCSSNKNTVSVPFYLYNSDTEFAEANGYVFSYEFLLDAEQENGAIRCGDGSAEYYRAHGLTADCMEEIESILEKEVHREIIAFRYTGEDFDERELIEQVRKVFLKNGEDNRLSGLLYRRVNDYVVIYE